MGSDHESHEDWLKRFGPVQHKQVRHVKRGTIYTVLFEGQLQWSNQPQLEDTIMTVYKSESGKIWIRPSSEFNDGRFKELN